jgi:hypothetical protein
MHEIAEVEIERAAPASNRMAIIAMMIIIGAVLIGGPSALALYLSAS